MWLLVLYDLPTSTAEGRRAYSRFHRSLVRTGYEMMQFSVYRKHAGTPDRAARELAKIENMCPTAGLVSVLQVTERQMARITTIWNEKPKKEPAKPRQLVLI